MSPLRQLQASKAVGRDYDERVPIAKLDPVVTAFDRDFERQSSHKNTSTKLSVFESRHGSNSS